MKCRNSFVSNSSSASFMIYGADVTDYVQEPEFLDSYGKLLLEHFKNRLEDRDLRSWLRDIIERKVRELESIEDKEEYHKYLIDEIQRFSGICMMLENTNLELKNVDGEELFLGRDPRDVTNDSLKFGEFKKQIRDEIKNVIPKVKDEDIDWIKRCWFDG